jgi:alkylhydroperoxidase family enzyme
MSEGDLAPLRAVRLSDRGIHDAVVVAAYFSFVNRLAQGLGVELET